MVPSLYIHIPFCRMKCGYCDFYSIRYDTALARLYISTLCAQLDRTPGSFSTIYIGGGTPSVLAIPLWERLLASLAPLARATCEFTVESNPESFNAVLAGVLHARGVNRISIGVQSLNDDKLKILGRPHSAAQARNAVEIARTAGFTNVSADCIFGVCGETPLLWKRDLADLASLPLEHISAYALTVEKRTPLARAVRSSTIVLPKHEDQAAMFTHAMEYLPRRGFQQYEVSNFARKARQCLHNFSYWQNAPYLGLGPSAVSYIGGVRSRNVADVREYIEKADAGIEPAGGEKLSRTKKARETAALKIRTREGIDRDWFAAHTGFDLFTLEEGPIKSLLKQRLIALISSGRQQTGIRLTKKGFLFADTVSSSLI